ncbi:MAG: arsenite efflux MFS transporter ArsK, partial [Devosia sp.]
FGPAQVLIRFGTLLAGRNSHPIVPALVSLAALPVSIALLALGAPALAAGMLFIVLFGFGSGLKSIVQGSLPLALFGSAAYGARLGVMASARQILASLAPFALAYAVEAVGARPALWLVAAVGVLGLLCLVETARRIAR